MPMTPDQRAALEQEIATGLSNASAIASLFGPQGAAIALIGKAVAAVEPTLVEDVVAMFDKVRQGDPTADEETALANKIQSLFTPEDL